MTTMRGTMGARTAAARAAAGRFAAAAWLFSGLAAASPAEGAPRVVFEAYSPYHHVLVVDEGGVRTLSFDGSHETRMSLRDPLQGHFEYTEFFHLGWLWNSNVSRVLMIGLGGGSTQRSFLHHHPGVTIDSVELDPVVVGVATNFFGVPIDDRHRVRVSDGRSFLRRARERYDLIVLDAYTRHRYGSQIPHHLATREFFELARDRLTPDGVLAYNVITISRLGGAEAGLALARTLGEVFPQVYCFQAATSRNVVMIATRDPRRLTNAELARRAAALAGGGVRLPPGVVQRLGAFQMDVPRRARAAPVLTDDYAPVESLGTRRPSR